MRLSFIGILLFLLVFNVFVWIGLDTARHGQHLSHEFIGLCAALWAFSFALVGLGVIADRRLPRSFLFLSFGFCGLLLWIAYVELDAWNFFRTLLR